MPETKTKKRVGRPSKYLPAYCEKLIKYFDTDHIREIEVTHTNRKGETWTAYEEKANKLPTLAGFCALINISRPTLYAWIEEYKEFLYAYTRARHMYEDRLSDLAARGYLNPAFSIFLAKNTLNWKDKAEVTHSGELEHKHFFEKMIIKAESTNPSGEPINRIAGQLE